MYRKDLTGQVFGRLTVLGYSHQDQYNRSHWVCLCECGNKKTISSNSLSSGKTRSCGCLDKEAHSEKPNRTTHGLGKHRLYRIWKAMKNRCLNPNSPDYQKYYGSRSITICDEWRYNYWKFYLWAICNGYHDGLSIDRIDVNGNYEPSNCRWATPKEQRVNQRRVVEGGDSH